MAPELTLRRADDRAKDERNTVTSSTDELDGPRQTTPASALAALREGNTRFVAGTALHPNQDAGHRAALATGQNPFAVLFGCSDSRLAAEIIFDRGLGDLFVVRTAGHALGPQVLGSIEYAIAVLQTPLVVVLGHSSCGAVTAALDTAGESSTPPGFIADVVDAIAPSIATAEAAGVRDVDAVVDVHVAQTVTRLQELSEITSAAVRGGSCQVVGMSYRLADGRVRLITSPLARDEA
jgi:carbonic anhydrase